jgi:soluble lytic murein transglycosylase
MIKGILGFVWMAMLLLPQSWQGVQGESSASLPLSADPVEHADSLFSTNQFRPALFSYRQFLDKKSSSQTSELLFKTAFAAFKAKDFSYSAQLFAQLRNERRFLPEYSAYFYIQSLWQTDPKKAAKESEQYLTKYKKHAFADSLIVPLAEYFMNNKQYSKARKYFLRAKAWRVNRLRDAEFLIAAADALLKSGNVKGAQKAYRQIIKKYPSKPEVLVLVERLQNEAPAFIQKERFNCLNVYIANKKYREARRKLEHFIKQKPDAKELDKARFLLTKIYYLRGSYKTALYGFKNMLKKALGTAQEPHIRIYLARCYRKLGIKNKAIEHYLEYADRFPRRRLAAEAVWKCAWLAEEQHHPQKALSYYHQVYTRWPRSEFAREACFREGFTWYRLGNYKQADSVFTYIRFKNGPDAEKNRAQYWSALCRETMGDTITGRRLRVELARNMWDDYYTMRSYLHHKTFLDSSEGFAEKLNSAKNPLLYYANGINTILPKIEAALQLKALLGDSYGKIALSDLRLSLKAKEEWIALAEIYKKFADYGKAYEIYDLINRRYFAQVSFVEKTFMLKERFPLYYDDVVFKYSKRYGVEPELVWAIMKQESKYKSTAHSGANAFGLMQLIPSTARELSRRIGRKLSDPRQLFNPEFNIRLGTLYVAQLQRQFSGRKERMLAAYNAGPHRVKRWQKQAGADQMDVFIENIEFAETRTYVRHVLKNYWAYKLLNESYMKNDDDLLFGLAE